IRAPAPPVVMIRRLPPLPLFPYTTLFRSEGNTAADTAAINDLCRRQGEAPPDETERHFVLRCGTGTLYWERHSEFSTYMWEAPRSEEHTSELQSRENLVCRLLLEKKKT